MGLAKGKNSDHQSDGNDCKKDDAGIKRKSGLENKETGRDETVEGPVELHTPKDPISNVPDDIKLEKCCIEQDGRGRNNNIIFSSFVL